MSWFEHGGSRIYYEDEGAGDAVLLLPGWSESIDEFATLRPALTKQNFRVIAADLPGSGKSGPQPRGYPASFYHDDAGSFLALLGRLDAVPAHLVGFSDGGEVELVMAEVQPSAARSLFAWGAAGQASVPPEVLDAFENVIDAPMEGWEGFSQHLKNAYGEENARTMAHNFVAAQRAIAQAGGDISLAQAGNITCRALMLGGEHDQIIPPALVHEIATAIPGARCIDVQEAGHAIHRDRPEWFTQTLVDWLRGQA